MYWFCHVLTWIHHRYICVPHPEPSSLFPPHTSPLGRPSAPAPSIQYRASNLDWRLISYMILYMFQCHYSVMMLSETYLGKLAKKKKILLILLFGLYSKWSYIFLELILTSNFILYITSCCAFKFMLFAILFCICEKQEWFFCFLIFFFFFF